MKSDFPNVTHFRGPGWSLPMSPQGLEKLGFPWILSSESRLINGLRGMFREKYFARLLPCGGGDTAVEVMWMRRIVHEASLA
jgi:hypothetical protein